MPRAFNGLKKVQPRAVTAPRGASSPNRPVQRGCLFLIPTSPDARRCPACSPGGNTLQKAAHLPAQGALPASEMTRRLLRALQRTLGLEKEAGGSFWLLRGLPSIPHAPWSDPTTLLIWKEEGCSERARAWPKITQLRGASRDFTSSPALSN